MAEWHKGWHSRGYLPHFDGAEVLQALTFRLGDAMPATVIEGWKRELTEQWSAGLQTGADEEETRRSEDQHS